jgi:predicted nucleotidyltransferase
MADRIHILRLKAVAQLLKELNQDIVFVGGATVSLYTDGIAPPMRPTDDIDVVVELATYQQYVILEEKLRSIGFQHDQESGVICRYKIQGIIVDIMPTEPHILGFSNRWYPDGFRHSVTYALDENLEIQIFPLAYFMASKLEAFQSRGKGQYRTSTDFEDLVYIWENNAQFNTILSAHWHKPQLKEFLQSEIKNMVKDPAFEEGLLAHLEPLTRYMQQTRIIAQLRSLLEN